MQQHQRLRSLLLDNYDSYTFNLYQLLAQVNGVEPLVYKNDAIDLEGVRALVRSGQVHNIVISPGPGSPDKPDDIGVCLAVIQQLHDVPILGVCLGHQALAVAEGGRVVQAPEPVHGRISSLEHSGHALLRDIPSGEGQGFDVVRYHSLVVEEASLPASLEPIAWTLGGHHAAATAAATAAGAAAAAAGDEVGRGATAAPPPDDAAGAQQPRLVMALAHRSRPHWGVQFHPESICTRYGMQLLLNFHRLSRQHLGLAASQCALPSDLVVTPTPPGCLHAPWPWPPAAPPGAEAEQPLGLVWARCAGALQPRDPAGAELLFSRLFKWQDHTFWLDRLSGLRARPSAAPSDASFASHASVGASPSFSAGSRGGGGASQQQQQQRAHVANLVLLFGMTLGALVITVYVLSSVLEAQQAARVSARLELQDSLQQMRTLRFAVCRGVAEERLSLVYGVLVAAELGRAVVLPSLPAGPAGTAELPFGARYDEEAFVQGLAALGVDVVREAELRGVHGGVPSPTVDVSGIADTLQLLHTKHREVLDLRITCPLFCLAAGEVRDSNAPIMWAVLDALRPALQPAKLVHQAVGALRAAGTDRRFNLLHLTLDAEWAARCAAQQGKQGALPVEDCVGNVTHIDQVLQSYNVPTSTPLFVSANWNATLKPRAVAAVEALREAGYTVLTAQDMPPGLFVGDPLHDSALAAELALAADRFLGNPADPLAGLLVMQRRRHGRWAGFYTRSPVLLEAHLPGRMLPWVFAYTSATPESDYMVQAAVRSAARHRGLQPFCLWAGNTTGGMYGWLRDAGVVMLHHSLDWAPELWSLAVPHLTANAQESRLFATKLALLNNAAAADLPALPQLEQYAYALLTSPHVLFLRDTSLITLAAQLPRVITLHTAHADERAAPAVGALLLNLLELRASHDEFKVFMLTSRHGGMFPDYGPGVGGALAQFYEPYATHLTPSQTAAAAAAGSPITALSISVSHNYNSAVHVLHFDGPLVHELLEYYRTGGCAWGWQCHTALRKAACPHMAAWAAAHTEGAAVLAHGGTGLGHAMVYACETIYAPQIEWPKFKQHDEAQLPVFQTLLERAKEALARAEAVATNIVA